MPPAAAGKHCRYIKTKFRKITSAFPKSAYIFLYPALGTSLARKSRETQYRAKAAKKNVFIPCAAIRQEGGENSRPDSGTYMTMPPQTFSTWPVMYLAASEARKATASATSAGVPSSPSGIRACIFWRCSSFSLSVMAVRI